MYILFPPIKTYNQFHFKVDDIHEIYVEESGNKNGLPILFVHGGPGGGTKSDHRRFFDPEKYRIILFDQRGSGKSLPYAELEQNTTKNLIEDIEAIRNKLVIEKWCLFGGSWGSTLSLLYAEKYPENVLGLILRGIFLCREKEIDWFYKGGAGLIFPDYWADFCKHIPQHEQHDMLRAYYNILHGEDEIAAMGAAKAWSEWEGRASTLMPRPNMVSEFTQPHIAKALARIETHYFINKAFIAENQVLNDIDKIKNIPGIIVHGRYDMICPLENAYALHKAWPNSTLNIVREAGHSSSEPYMVDALIHATNELTRFYY